MFSSDEKSSNRKPPNDFSLFNPGLWRAILLGKTGIGTSVSVIVSIVCFQQARAENLTLGGSLKWYSLSLFFALLSVAFIIAVTLMFRKKKLD